ncbi:MAG TPA: thioredoxin family protein [Spirochaetota bacterium]|nr:thioredoxin family protein [Spirochaetota bacterium]HOM11350.1 thioredoxin family protein [Spirochaetota bacterium]HPP49736.1 thioredoxin family protein [Spirochaetota bacterium]
MKKLLICILMIIVSVTIACKQNNNDVQTQQNTAVETNIMAETQDKAIVTFVEIGSVNCIPCRMMQPVMKKVEEKYGSKVKIVFYDVWTQEGAPYAQKFGIRVIPTQVFLDKNGKEFFRHEGYFPFEAIDELLQKQGLKP